MTLGTRLAALGLALAFAAGPSLATAGDGCSGCCCEIDCEAAGEACESMTATPCCAEGQPTTPRPAERSLDGPPLAGPVPLQSVRLPTVPSASPIARTRNLAATTSPLRRSVVRRL